MPFLPTSSGPTAAVIFSKRRLAIPDLVVLSFYPLIILLAHLVRVLGLVPEYAEGPASSVLAFLTNKSNPLNVYVMELGWLWVSVLFGLHFWLTTWMSFKLAGSGSSHAGLQQQQQHWQRAAALRYAAATGLWCVVTQTWLGGAPILDRLFVWTGGRCELARGAGFGSSVDSAGAGGVTLRSVCGPDGTWVGFNASGHVFLATLGGCFLWFEVVYPVITGSCSSCSSCSAPYGTFDSADADADAGCQDALPVPWPRYGLYAVKAAAVLVMLLDWLMLVSTNLFFHSFGEALAGLAFAYSTVLAVYIV